MRIQVRKFKEAIGGGRILKAGTVLGYVSLALALAVLICARAPKRVALWGNVELGFEPVFEEVPFIVQPVIGRAYHCGETRPLSDAINIAMACKVYAQDHEDSFPKSLEELVPDYLFDRSSLLCRFSPTWIGYEYFGGKATDPPKNILLVSKAADSRGRRVVIHTDGKGTIEKYTPRLSASAR